MPQRRHTPGHFHAWDAGRVLNEYAVVYVTHGQSEFDSQATGLRSLEAGDALILFPGTWLRYRRLMLEEDPGGLPHVEEMIRTFDVSRTHFFRLFKEQTGQSPCVYHLQFTIRRAAEMLRDSPMSVKQIAATLGFRNPYHFSKLFNLKTGSSPRDYREHWREMSDRETVTTG